MSKDAYSCRFFKNFIDGFVSLANDSEEVDWSSFQKNDPSKVSIPKPLQIRILFKNLGIGSGVFTINELLIKLIRKAELNIEEFSEIVGVEAKFLRKLISCKKWNELRHLLDDKEKIVTLQNALDFSVSNLKLALQAFFPSREVIDTHLEPVANVVNEHDEDLEQKEVRAVLEGIESFIRSKSEYHHLLH